MAFENAPVIREIVLEPIYLPIVELVAVSAVPIIDQAGNPVRDDPGGNPLYGYVA